MQGTASIAEDVRQPPYLCPVCLAKVAYAIGVELRGGGGGGGGSRGGEGRGRNVEEKEGEEEEERGRKEYVRERYEALRSFCGKWEDVGMFAGYGAWLDVRLEGMA
jgi:archaemetzincin